MIKGKIKSGFFSIIAGLTLMLAPGTAFAMNNHSSDDSYNAVVKVAICHATGSSSNPYVLIAPSASGVINGHVGHQDGRDIIPPFDYKSHGVSKHFPGQNWDASGQAILHNGCKVEGGQGGGPQKDCDGDYDNSPASDCQAPQKDCDGDYDNSPQSECTPPQPQTDCDGDTDNSPASECTSGGQGGGPTGGGTTTTTTTTTPQVLGASTTVSAGAGSGPQIAAVPQGSVNGGLGAASTTVNHISLAGLVGALLSIGSGLVMLNRRQD